MSMKLALAMVGVAALTANVTAGPKDAWTHTLKDQKWTPLDAKAGDKGPQVAVVFGDPTAKGKPVGVLLKTAAGSRPGPHTHTSDDYVTVLQGTTHNYPAPGTDEGPALTVGGTWFQPGGKPHDNHCEDSSKDGCIIFVYMPNGFDMKPWVDPKAAKDVKKDPPKDVKKDAPKKP